MIFCLSDHQCLPGVPTIMRGRDLSCPNCLCIDSPPIKHAALIGLLFPSN
jgi:hypothetical protein